MTTTAPAPPKAPRPVTAAANRRTWMEPRVRAWWLAAGALLAISAFFAVARLIEWNRVRWVVNHGRTVNAVIDQIGPYDQGIRGNASPDNDVRIHIVADDLDKDLDLKGADAVSALEGYLDGRTALISLNDKIQIRIDPDDPTVWTYRTDTPPLLGKMFSAGLVLGPALVCLAAAFWVRRGVVRIWTSGVAQEFAVVKSHQTAAAPLSRVVLCTSLDGKSNQPIKVVVPMKLADPLPGQLIWLIYPAGKPHKAIAAMA